LRPIRYCDHVWRWRGELDRRRLLGRGDVDVRQCGRGTLGPEDYERRRVQSRRACAQGRQAGRAASSGLTIPRPRTQAAALELRPRGIHVALLIVDAGIQPVSGATRQGVAPEILADPSEIADAVRFLATQGSRGAINELQLTPLAKAWVP
jgi:hypothetical protein